MDVIGTVGSLLRTKEAAVNVVAQHHFQGLTISLVQSKKEKGHHHADHDDCCGAAGQQFVENEKQRQSDEDSAAEADELPPGEIEKHLGFHL